MFKIVYLILFAGICLIDRSCLTQASKCVMKGICDTAAFGHVPCIYNGNPMAMTDSAARDVLKEICPELANEKALCCDSEQIIDLKNHAELFGVFLKVCPACYANYQHLLCQITCSPKQAEFVKILHHEVGEEKKEQVTEIDVFLNQDFADGFYKSCANISRFGEKVIDVFCKPWPADKCNPLRMIRYFGADFFHQGHSPYQIDYVLSTDSHIKWDGEDHPVVKITPYKCSDSVNGKPKCACEHCPQSC